jgi:ankyrin repeat protein
MNTDFPFWHLTTYDLGYLQRAAEAGDLQTVQEILASGDLAEPHLALVNLSKYGDVDSVKTLIEAGCPMNSNTFMYVAYPATHYYQLSQQEQLRHLISVFDCLKVLVNGGCPIDLETDQTDMVVTYAAMLGHIECLQALIRAGCSADNDMAVSMAADYGQTHCLKLLVESGFAMSAIAVLWAAENNHIDCLKLLIAAECPMSRQVIKQAQAYKQTAPSVECLKLLIAAGCPYDVTACDLNTWSEDQLDSAFARKHIWPLDLKSREIGCHCLKQCCQKKIDMIKNLKAKKAETERVAMETCKVLPLDVVKHVLCSYF